MSDRDRVTVRALVALREELQSLEPSLRLDWRMEHCVNSSAARRTARPWASPLRGVAVAASVAVVVTAGWALHRSAGAARSAQQHAREASPAWAGDAEVLRVRASLGATGITSQVLARRRPGSATGSISASPAMVPCTWCA